MKRFDAVVLGAGIVGVSTALHLQARGRAVALLDRRGAGEETSYGNAGLIERSSVIPYAFPRSMPALLRYATNTRLDVRFHWSFLPRIAPWLFEYWRQSSPQRLADATRAMLPLIENSIVEHQPLIEAAGVGNLVRKDGWLELFRSESVLRQAVETRHLLNPYGLKSKVLSWERLKQLEPGLRGEAAGAIQWQDPWTVSDPGAITQSYARLFESRGGAILSGDARSLSWDKEGWTLQDRDGPVHARDVVVALGAWSDAIFKPLGYRIPLEVKRGYHRHFRQAETDGLRNSIVDVEYGYVLAPMTQGVRLTTGIEFAPRDSKPTPVQINRLEPIARKLLPMGGAVETTPWLGNRPCLPDMRPVIGEAPRHKGLWFAFGHAHHGFTLGPATGRLLAEMITGEPTFADARPFAADRF